MSDSPKPPPSLARLRVAWAIASVADLLQIVLFPLFVEGALSPLDAALDAGVFIALTWLLGFHWALLPTFVVEAAPVVDLVPTWTGAVLIATRAKKALPAASSIGQ